MVGTKPTMAAMRGEGDGSGPVEQGAAPVLAGGGHRRRKKHGRRHCWAAHEGKQCATCRSKKHGNTVDEPQHAGTTSAARSKGLDRARYGQRHVAEATSNARRVRSNGGKGVQPERSRWSCALRMGAMVAHHARGEDLRARSDGSHSRAGRGGVAAGAPSELRGVTAAVDRGRRAERGGGGRSIADQQDRSGLDPPWSDPRDWGDDRHCRRGGGGV